MKTMTQAAYAQMHRPYQVVQCPNPTCHDGFDHARDEGRVIRGYAYAPCSTCGGLGRVKVTP